MQSKDKSLNLQPESSINSHPVVDVCPHLGSTHPECTITGAGNDFWVIDPLCIAEMLYYLPTGSHHGRKPCGPKKLRTMEESVELSGALAMHVHNGDTCFGIHLESSGIDLVDI
jgi:hypothetical protein